jgi:aryl-alcohol dehydrogenase-like predicted oxidoreductase
MNLGIGSVQFGTPYGISNSEGQIDKKEVLSILETALQLEVKYIDTATLYGTSEQVLGECLPQSHGFNIITKTIRFESKVITNREGEILGKIFDQSLRKLRRKAVYGLMTHDAGDLLKPGGNILWEKMQALKKQGLVEKIGSSAYSTDEIDLLSKKYPIELIQLPINVLDQRLIQDGSLARLKERNVEVHCRSIFLQGLLLMDVATLPEFFDPIRDLLLGYHKFLKKNKLSSVEGAISFIQQIKEIDCMIVGTCNVEQLKDAFQAYSNRKKDKLNFDIFALENESFINPAKWDV